MHCISVCVCVCVCVCRHGDSGAVVHLSSLAGLMDAVLLLQVALLGAVQHTLWALGLRLFRIFHTEVIGYGRPW